jgi:hypothetical protein
VAGWFDGKVVYYISTDASDAGVAKGMGANFVPGLANALTASPTAVDDIYAFTNFTQGNVIPSAPGPVGPMNKDTTYTPLWRVSTVTWNTGTRPVTLTSEAQIKQAASVGLVTISQTDIVVNCAVVARPGAGKLPGSKLLFGEK